MPRLTIDNRAVEVESGVMILEAARRVGIEIPTLCFVRELAASTSCMVCVVKVAGLSRLVPSCATMAREGMIVESQSAEVQAARRANVELLLSDHLGDCIAPCHTSCPAHLDIPGMIRLIAAGQLAEAAELVSRRLPMPGVLGHICPAPCEKACRRTAADHAISIRSLHRFVAEHDLAHPRPTASPGTSSTGKRVAVIGAGPAGLSAAFYLMRVGHACTVFDENEKPGGLLRGLADGGGLPPAVLDAEIDRITRTGVDFRMKVRVGRDVPFDTLRRQYDAVVVAAGESSARQFTTAGCMATPHGIEVNPHTLATSLPGVFACGDAARSARMAVRAMAAGHTAAFSIDQLLRSEPVTGEHTAFTVHIGRLLDGEIAAFAAEAVSGDRIEPATVGAGLTPEQAALESRRCLHCDCRKADACRLRTAASICGARSKHPGEGRRVFVQNRTHPDIIFEQGKCISCGLCIQTAQRHGEPLGLTFIGRGLDMSLAVPFGRSLADGLTMSARECVKVCPTGALAFRDNSRPLSRPTDAGAPPTGPRKD